MSVSLDAIWIAAGRCLLQKQEVIHMLYEDKYGNLKHPEEVEAMSPHEVEELGFHVFDKAIA